jgi:hypothetical protein
LRVLRCHGEACADDALGELTAGQHGAPSLDVRGCCVSVVWSQRSHGPAAAQRGIVNAPR